MAGPFLGLCQLMGDPRMVLDMKDLHPDLLQLSFRTNIRVEVLATVDDRSP
jgi:hypothetical protein